MPLADDPADRQRENLQASGDLCPPSIVYESGGPRLSGELRQGAPCRRAASGSMRAGLAWSDGSPADHRQMRASGACTIAANCRSLRQLGRATGSTKLQSRLSGLRLVVIEEDPARFGAGINEQAGGSVGAGSNEMIGPATPRTQALVTLAEALQEKCAETRVGWGQSRPPCPHHPHPLRAESRDGEAWWTCQQRHEAVYRIGRGEVLAATRSKKDRRRPHRQAGS
jgi:hypothetical protein